MDACSNNGHIHLRLTRSWPLIAGVLLLAWLWFGPLPELARRAFSPHMMMHLSVTVVVAPLFVVGLLRLLRPPPHVLRRPLLAAIAASGLELVVVWGWHAPALHEAAAGWPVVFGLQQVSFLIAGMGLWSVSLLGRRRRGYAIGTLAMLFTSMHMAMLGVLLVLAPTLLYAPQFCLGAFGLDPLTDQQFGGGLMVLFGASAYAGGGAWLALRLAKA